jgi:hypothetical protein
VLELPWIKRMGRLVLKHTNLKQSCYKFRKYTNGGSQIESHYRKNSVFYAPGSDAASSKIGVF